MDRIPKIRLKQRREITECPNTLAQPYSTVKYPGARIAGGSASDSRVQNAEREEASSVWRLSTSSNQADSRTTPPHRNAMAISMIAARPAQYPRRCKDPFSRIRQQISLCCSKRLNSNPRLALTQEIGPKDREQRRNYAMVMQTAFFQNKKAVLRF